MPRYSKDKILAEDNPYELLGKDPESLAESQDELEKLNDLEKNALATKMLLACPQDELRELHNASTVLANPTGDENNFAAVLVRAIEVASRIASITDSRNPEPHRFFCGEEFTSDLFNEFNQLSLTLVNRDPVELASTLAISIDSEKNVHALMKNLNCIFQNSSFLENLTQALVLRHQLEGLKTTEAYSVFVSKEFNPALFASFENLVNAKLQGQEARVAKHLAPSFCTENYSLVLSQLELLSSEQSENVFNRIHDQLLKNVTRAQKRNSDCEDLKEDKPRRTAGFFSPSPYDEIDFKCNICIPF